jgi:hypothetical protein
MLMPVLLMLVLLLMLMPAAAGHSRGAINATLYGGKHGDIPMMVLVAGRYDLTLNMVQRCVRLSREFLNGLLDVCMAASPQCCW